MDDVTKNSRSRLTRENFFVGYAADATVPAVRSSGCHLQ